MKMNEQSNQIPVVAIQYILQYCSCLYICCRIFLILILYFYYYIIAACLRANFIISLT
jgi:hypothetical protein